MFLSNPAKRPVLRELRLAILQMDGLSRASLRRALGANKTLQFLLLMKSEDYNFLGRTNPSYEEEVAD